MSDKLDQALAALGIDRDDLHPDVLAAMEKAAEPRPPSTDGSKPAPRGLPSDPDELREERDRLAKLYGEVDPDGHGVDQEDRAGARLLRTVERKLERAEARAQRQAELDAETDPRKLAEELPRW